MVKNILAGLGIVFLALIVCLLFLIGVTRAFNASGHEYAVQSAGAIAKAWSLDELKQRAAPQLLANTPEESIKAIFATFAKLGPLQSVDDCKGQSGFNLNAGQPWITGMYFCQVKFEQDTVELKLFLVRDNTGWKIGEMQMHSNYLIKNSGT